MKTRLAMIILLFVHGCGTSQPALRTYTLYSRNVTAPHRTTYRDATIKVAYPRSVKEKESNKMYYSYSSAERGAYQNSRWSNTLNLLLQGVLVDALVQSKNFKAVLPYTSSLSEDYRLESYIFAFSHSVRGSSSYAIVSLQFNVIDNRTGSLVKSKKFNYREPTPTIDAEGYVKATNTIMARLSRDLLRWL